MNKPFDNQLRIVFSSQKLKSLSILLFTFLLIGLQSCEVKPQKKSIPNSNSNSPTVYDLKYPLTKPLISGHRGAKEYLNYPENCLETFQYLRSKIDCIIECDVAETKDGVLVMMHDRSIDRTTNGTGEIGNKTYDEIKDLQLKDFEGNLTDYKIPTFEAILKWAKESNTILSVDKKKSVALANIIDAIERQNAEPNCMMISYSLNMSKEIYDLAPELMQSVSIRNMDELRRWEKSKIPPPDKTIAFTGTRQSPKVLYDEIHKYGISCIFGTLGNIDNQAVKRGPKIYKDLIEKGVDIIATDRPLEVGKVLAEEE